MAQGTRVTGNLFHDNTTEDLFMEVDHGPFLVDNNIFLSPRTLLSVSQGGAYVHNLIAGALVSVPFDARQTPFHKAHSTDLAGMHNNPRGDDKYFNNIFAGPADLSFYDKAPLAVKMEGNVFLKGAKPSNREAAPVVKAAFDPGLKLVESGVAFELELSLDDVLGSLARRLVTTEVLGRAAIPGLPYEQADGSPVRIETDYFGKARNEANPTPGPFKAPGPGRLRLKVGPETRISPGR
jgi:alpha-N-arabinofuranosidase